jgi:hypothetical protein
MWLLNDCEVLLRISEALLGGAHKARSNSQNTVEAKGERMSQA